MRETAESLLVEEIFQSFKRPNFCQIKICALINLIYPVAIKKVSVAAPAVFWCLGWIVVWIIVVGDVNWVAVCQITVILLF